MAILLDVKEFRATREDLVLGVGVYDPYKPIRDKIEDARKKFRELDQYCCGLVLYNCDRPLVDLKPIFVHGAMLGNAGFIVPLVSNLAEKPDSLENIFIPGKGRMWNPKDGPRNTTISAILVLEQLPIGKMRFDRAVKAEEAALGRTLRRQERLERIEKTQDYSRTQLRVVVHENPYARLTFPRKWFDGSYDAHYGDLNGSMELLWAGEEVIHLEKGTR